MEGIIFLKKGVSLIFILTDPFQCYLSLSAWGVCVCVCCVCVCVCVCMCVFCLFTPFLSVLFVSQEVPSLIASYQLINDFHMRIIFEKKRHCGK